MITKCIRIVIVTCALAILAIMPLSSAIAKTQSDLSGFRAEVLSALQLALPDMNFTPDPADPARILSDSMTFDVTNIFNHANLFPDVQKEVLVSDFVDAALSGMKMLEQQEEVSLSELVIVLRSTDYINHIRSIGMPFLSRQINDSLHAIIMRNTPRAFMTVTLDMFPDENADNLFAIGAQNSAAFLSNLGTEVYDDFTLYFTESDYELTSALALIPGFWDVVRESFGDDFIFVMPRRDQIFVFDARPAGAVERAVTMINIAFADQYNLLSSEVYALENGKIVEIRTPR